jgi:predicted nucleotidyltransferase
VDNLSTIVDDMSTKNLALSLFPLTRILVLRELVLADGKKIHLRELARRTGLDPRGVQREVRNLLATGVLIEECSGNQKLYFLNKKCPVYDELRLIVIKTVGIADEIRTALNPIKSKISRAFIYGSFAKGTFDSESDVDLMIIGKASLRDVVSVTSDTSKKLRRIVNAVTFSVAEYKQKMKEDGFIKRVENEVKIILIGDDNEPE